MLGRAQSCRCEFWHTKWWNLSSTNSWGSAGADGDNNKVDNSKFSKNFYNFEEDSVRLYQFLDAFQESDKVEIMWADAILILMYV